MKTLLKCLLIVSIGCLLFVIPYVVMSMSDGVALVFVFAGAMTVGAGIGSAYKRPALGALCGLSLYFMICIARDILSGR